MHPIPAARSMRFARRRAEPRLHLSSHGMDYAAFEYAGLPVNVAVFHRMNQGRFEHPPPAALGRVIQNISTPTGLVDCARFVHLADVSAEEWIARSCTQPSVRQVRIDLELPDWVKRPCVAAESNVYGLPAWSAPRPDAVNISRTMAVSDGGASPSCCSEQTRYGGSQGFGFFLYGAQAGVRTDCQ